MKEGLSLKKAALTIVLISLTGKVFGFIRELLLANYFGTSSVVDAFLMSVTIPSILFGFLPAIGVGFTPVYFGIKEKNTKNQFVSNAIIVSAIVSMMCIIFTIFFNKSIVSLCAPGFNNDNKNLTSQFLYITVWCVLFNTPVQIFTAYLNCNQDYINSNLSNLFVSIIQAACVVVAAKTTIVFLPIGIVAPWLFQLIWLSYSSQKKGFRLVQYRRKDDNVKKLLAISIPLFFSNILVDVNGFVDKMLSSSLDEGSLSALNYAFTLRAVFVTAAAAVITTIVYPRISESVKEKEIGQVCNLTEKYFDYISFIIIPIAVLCIIFARNIVCIMLMRGQFNQRSVEITTSPFIMYTLSLAIIVWRELIIKIMYSYGQTRRNLFYSLIEVAINVCVSLLLVRYLGHTGLALATTIAVTITFPIYVHNLCRTIELFNVKARAITILKELVAVSAMSMASMMTTKIIGILSLSGISYYLLDAIVSGCVGIACYCIICYLLKVKECRELASLLHMKILK